MDCQSLPLWGRWHCVSNDGEGEAAARNNKKGSSRWRSLFKSSDLRKPMEPLKIAIFLPHRAVFGPMAGFTDAPCRRLMAQHGAGFTVSEMVSSRALVYGDHKTVSLLKAEPNGAPLWRADLWRSARDHGRSHRRHRTVTSSTLWISTWAARPPRSCPAAQAAS